MYEGFGWQDKGSMRDHCSAEVLTRDNFQLLWTYMAFLDYSGALFDEGGRLITGGDSILRVRWFVEACQRAWDLNWIPGQYLALDEFSHKGARSRYCDIGMFFANKPIKHSVDWVMLVDAKFNYPLAAHVFMKDGTKMADLIFDHLWNHDWTSKGHVILTDSRFGILKFLIKAHQHGTGVISTVKVPGKKKGKNDPDPSLDVDPDDDTTAPAATGAATGDTTDEGKIHENQGFPLYRIPKAERLALPRGHHQSLIRVQSTNTVLCAQVQVVSFLCAILCLIIGAKRPVLNLLGRL